MSNKTKKEEAIDVEVKAEEVVNETTEEVVNDDKTEKAEVKEDNKFIKCFKYTKANPGKVAKKLGVGLLKAAGTVALVGGAYVLGKKSVEGYTDDELLEIDGYDDEELYYLDAPQEDEIIEIEEFSDEVIVEAEETEE